MNKFVLCLLMIAPGIWAHSIQTNNRKISWRSYFTKCNGKFMCKSLDILSKPKCICTTQVCDGVMDCRDGSDEVACRKEFKCPEEQYKCKGEDKCISVEQICDGEKNCTQGDDEARCQFNCPDEQYKCKGEDKCITIEQICDGEKNCTLGDDEARCQPRCPVGEYLCADGIKCLSQSMVCNGNEDCVGGDDESVCPPRCPVGEYLCADGIKCLSQSMVCDGNEDCVGGDDESVCPCGPDQFTCSDRSCIDQNAVCNRADDCPDSGDEQTCPSCGDNWSLAASFTNAGVVTEGSKEDLINKVLAGYEVRLLITNLNYLTSVQNLRTIGDNVCAQALFHISKSGYNRFQTNSYLWLLNACSTGQVNIRRYFVGSNTLVSASTVTWPMSWFVRPLHYTPLHTSGDLVLAGNLNDLITNVKAGHDVRIVEDCIGYVAPVDSIEIPPNEDFAVAQAVYHVSQREDPPNWVFQGNDYWLFTNRITDGTAKFTRWTIGVHENRGDNELKPQMTWHTESCWKLTYSHDAAGNPLEGSLQDLLTAIQAGHRVKIIYGNIISVEPDELTIRGGHVTATVLRMIKNDPTDIKSFLLGAQWNWRIQSTTGKVETFRSNVGEYVEQERSIGMSPCTWFTDVRQWNLKLVNDDTGAVQAGAKSDLTDAIRDGAKIRYILADNSDRLIIHEADNLAISGSEVGAMHVRSVELVDTMNSNTEVSFPLVDLFYVFRISSTVGEVAMTKWTVGDRVNRGRSVTTAGMTWFADI